VVEALVSPPRGHIGDESGSVNSSLAGGRAHDTSNSGVRPNVGGGHHPSPFIILFIIIVALLPDHTISAYIVCTAYKATRFESAWRDSSLIIRCLADRRVLPVPVDPHSNGQCDLSCHLGA
jgi:hypothetical protein